MPCDAVSGGVAWTALSPPQCSVLSTFQYLAQNVASSHYPSAGSVSRGKSAVAPTNPLRFLCSDEGGEVFIGVRPSSSSSSSITGGTRVAPSTATQQQQQRRSTPMAAAAPPQTSTTGGRWELCLFHRGAFVADPDEDMEDSNSQDEAESADDDRRLTSSEKVRMVDAAAGVVLYATTDGESILDAFCSTSFQLPSAGRDASPGSSLLLWIVTSNGTIVAMVFPMDELRADGGGGMTSIHRQSIAPTHSAVLKLNQRTTAVSFMPQGATSLVVAAFDGTLSEISMITCQLPPDLTSEQSSSTNSAMSLAVVPLYRVADSTELLIPCAVRSTAYPPASTSANSGGKAAGGGGAAATEEQTVVLSLSKGGNIDAWSITNSQDRTEVFGNLQLFPESTQEGVVIATCAAVVGMGTLWIGLSDGRIRTIPLPSNLSTTPGAGIESSTTARTLQYHKAGAPVTALTVMGLGGGASVWSAADDGQIVVWDTETYQPKGVFQHQQRRPFASVLSVHRTLHTTLCSIDVEGAGRVWSVVETLAPVLPLLSMHSLEESALQQQPLLAAQPSAAQPPAATVATTNHKKMSPPAEAERSRSESKEQDDQQRRQAMEDSQERARACAFLARCCRILRSSGSDTNTAADEVAVPPPTSVASEFPEVQFLPDALACIGEVSSLISTTMVTLKLPSVALLQDAKRVCQAATLNRRRAFTISEKLKPAVDDIFPLPPEVSADPMEALLTRAECIAEQLQAVGYVAHPQFDLQSLVDKVMKESDRHLPLHSPPPPATTSIGPTAVATGPAFLLTPPPEARPALGSAAMAMAPMPHTPAGRHPLPPQTPISAMLHRDDVVPRAEHETLLRELEAEIATLHDARAQQIQAMSSTKSKLHAAENAKISLESELEDEKESNRQAISRMDTQVQQAKKALQKARHEHERYESQIAELQGALDSERSINIQTTTQESIKDRRIAELEGKLRSAEQLQLQANARLSEQRNEELEELKERLGEELQRERELSSHSIAELERECKELRGNAAMSRKDAQMLREELEAKNGIVQELLQIVKDNAGTIDELNVRYAAKKREIAALRPYVDPSVLQQLTAASLLSRTPTDRQDDTHRRNGMAEESTPGRYSNASASHRNGGGGMGTQRQAEYEGTSSLSTTIGSMQPRREDSPSVVVYRHPTDRQSIPSYSEVQPTAHHHQQSVQREQQHQQQQYQQQYQPHPRPAVAGGPPDGGGYTTTTAAARGYTSSSGGTMNHSSSVARSFTSSGVGGYATQPVGNSSSHTAAGGGAPPVRDRPPSLVSHSQSGMQQPARSGASPAPASMSRSRSESYAPVVTASSLGVVADDGVLLGGDDYSPPIHHQQRQYGAPPPLQPSYQPPPRNPSYTHSVASSSGVGPARDVPREVLDRLSFASSPHLHNNSSSSLSSVSGVADSGLGYPSLNGTTVSSHVGTSGYIHVPSHNSSTRRF